MVQILDDPYSGNLFGRIGKGIGKGLSEQLPKEIERGRLASGLKSIAERAKAGKMDPLDVFTETAGTAGITPQHLYTLGPLLNQMQQKRNFLSRGDTATQQGSVSPQMQAAQNIPDQGINAQKVSQDIAAPMPNSGFASPSQIANYKKNILQEPGFDQINSLAKDYLNQGITQDVGEATKLAAQELTQNRAAQQAKIASFRSEFGGEKGRLARDLQSGGLGDYKDVTGQIQNSLLDQGEYMVSQGVTPESAAQQLSDIALDLGKTVNKLKDTGSFTNMFKSSKEKETALRTQKKDFEKYGYGEQFDDMAAAELGITPLQAAHVLSPLKNKEVESILDKTKKLSQKSTVDNIDPKTLDKLIKSIKPKDNLFSIEYKLREKGLDLQQFKRRILELEEAGEIALTPQQKRQQERAVSESFLGDLLFQAL